MPFALPEGKKQDVVPEVQLWGRQGRVRGTCAGGAGAGSPLAGEARQTVSGAKRRPLCRSRPGSDHPQILERTSQYLGRIVGELLGIAENERAQVLISSHSPSILGRVQPDFVRYFLGHELTRSTSVKPIPLPAGRDEEFKYVREAVQGYPELYFARLVILGEGASEQIVLHRLFDASGKPTDTHFICVVPLGGRHVNHFWRLLHGLEIPFLTLLDLDREKDGAGWGRVQYVRDQLVQRYGPGHNKLRVQDGEANVQSLEEPAYNTLRAADVAKVDDMDKWLTFFRTHFDVFFLSPLDLDFAMLEAFPNEYKGLATPPHGPRLPTREHPEYQNAIYQRMKQVLSSDSSNAPTSLGSTYSEVQKELFAWYKYLFVDGSKPVAHMRALLSIDKSALTTSAPVILKQLVERARQILSSPKSKPDDLRST